MLASTQLKKGPGIPLVFLHGLLGSSADWEAVCDFLPPCNAFGFDLPGHGQSPFTDRFTLPFPRLHLIGYSMGGRIAMQYAAKNPEQIASLTLLSVHPGLQTPEEKQARLLQDEQWVKLLFELPIDEFLTQWYNQPIFKTFKPNFSMRRKQNIPDLAAALLHYSLAHQSRFEPKEVLVGEHDTKFRSLYPTPRLIPNSGHMIHFENPKAAAQIVQEKL